MGFVILVVDGTARGGRGKHKHETAFGLQPVRQDRRPTHLRTKD